MKRDMEGEEAVVLSEAGVGTRKRKPRKRSVKYLDGEKELRDEFTRPGRVRVLYDSGDEYEGDVHCAVGERELSRNGEGLYTWKGSKATYEGNYTDNSKNGKGRYVAPNGDVYEGNFKNGLKSGQGVYTYTNGDRYVGNWLRGERHGPGEYIYADGSTEEVEYSHGSRSVLPRQSSTFTARKRNPLGLVLAGGPASGKTTQARLLERMLGVISVDPVVLVEQAAARKKTRVERQVATYTEKSMAVPDVLLVGLVFQRLKEKDVRSRGFVLIDFPKTVTQARLLTDRGVTVDRYIHLSVSKADMEERVRGRRKDPETGKIYHLAFDPPPRELLDKAIPLSRDSKDRVAARRKHHERHVGAVKKHYGKVLEVDGSADKTGVSEEIRHSLYHSERPVGIIIAGPPGAGKGTQSANIHKKHGLIHLSSGDLLRAEVRAGTKEGKLAKKYMDAGDLVPAELIVGIIKKRLSKNDVREHGFLLDGFPRQVEEAEALLEMGVAIDLYLVLDVSEERLLQRVLGREIDPETGHSYHAKFNPAPANIRSRLKTRADDTAEKLERRIKTFKSNIGSIKKVFGKAVHEVDGNEHISRVNSQVEGAIQKMIRSRIQEGPQ